jgi:hypothetical protein
MHCISYIHDTAWKLRFMHQLHGSCGVPPISSIIRPLEQAHLPVVGIEQLVNELFWTNVVPTQLISII